MTAIAKTGMLNDSTISEDVKAARGQPNSFSTKLALGGRVESSTLDRNGNLVRGLVNISDSVGFVDDYQIPTVCNLPLLREVFRRPIIEQGMRLPGIVFAC